MKISQNVLCNYPMLMSRFHLELLNVFTTKQMFGRVFTKYINEPINCWYRDESTGSESESLSFFRSVTMGVSMDLQSIIPNF
jgi:hypothetical protein